MNACVHECHMYVIECMGGVSFRISFGNKVDLDGVCLVEFNCIVPCG